MNKVFSNRIKELRKSRGLTQEELSEKIGIARSRYSNIELGSCEPNLELLIKLSNFYNVSVDYLLGQEDNYNCDTFLKLFKEKTQKQQNVIIHMLKEY